MACLEIILINLVRKISFLGIISLRMLCIKKAISNNQAECNCNSLEGNYMGLRTDHMKI